MKTFRGSCGHSVVNPETTTMDDGDTILFRCPVCGVWMEPTARSRAGLADRASVQATMERLHPVESEAVAKMIEEILTDDSPVSIRTVVGRSTAAGGSNSPGSNDGSGLCYTLKFQHHLDPTDICELTVSAHDIYRWRNQMQAVGYQLVHAAWTPGNDRKDYSTGVY